MLNRLGYLPSTNDGVVLILPPSGQIIGLCLNFGAWVVSEAAVNFFNVFVDLGTRG